MKTSLIHSGDPTILILILGILMTVPLWLYSQTCSGLCFNHFVWGAKARNCIKPCNWSGN
jgi:hypothetical protein